MAQGTEFEVQPGALDAGAGMAGSTARELQELTSSFRSVGERLADTVGQQAAADAALEFTVRWLLRLQGLSLLAESLATSLSAAAGDYRDTDRGAAEAFAADPPGP